MINSKPLIFEDWLDKDLHMFLENEFLFNTPHLYGHRSNSNNKKDNMFYTTTLDQNNPLIRFLFIKLQLSLGKKLILNQVYINVQHPHMDGNFHIDKNSTLTCLYMVTGDGDFETKNEESIKFKKNKLVCFDSSNYHRGLAPKKGVRITLAFKTQEGDKI